MGVQVSKDAQRPAGSRDIVVIRQKQYAYPSFRYQLLQPNDSFSVKRRQHLKIRCIRSVKYKGRGKQA
ncbi:hypothetical protein [Bacillus subtilis]|uniref:hypothetical protein n=2 Tax=Bacillus TaxID=1386 RepID=UPI0002C4DED4|nr:hypothetical protein [Bacillus subtilis]AGI30865.1 hypothetical protein I653_18155 [Bacillus subtilis subsp. subtilis str. BAB-1]ALS84185.1 hypothetical protein AT706_20660 [Bacillus subtilis subsp. subtilis]ASK25760.1 hypothetical protein BSSX_3896 [Bacillus subtilis]MCL9626902.1 hypothetical protein [Bacillus subtilis]MDL2029664.1 hypothetical protein [Bacillus subtilis]